MSTWRPPFCIKKCRNIAKKREVLEGDGYSVPEDLLGMLSELTDSR
jgi:hypothetical protein